MHRLKWVLRWLWRIARYPLYLNSRYNPLMTEAARRGLRSLGTVPDEDIAQMTEDEIREMYAFNPFDERFMDKPAPSTPETKAFSQYLAEQVRKRIQEEKRKQKPDDSDQQS